MTRYAEFVTPENVEVSYELAGIGSRFVAAVIDLCVLTAIFVAITIIAGMLSAALAFSHLLNGAEFWVRAVYGLTLFFILVGYHVVFELLWAGATPGKKFARLRVVRDGGYPVDAYSSLVRNLVRIVDLFPPIYGFGLVSIFCSAEYKRLGDWAAGTIVIKEAGADRLLEHRRVAASPLVAHFMPMVKSTDPITRDEYQAIRRFVERRHELPIAIQAHVAMRLAFPLLAKLGLDITLPVQWHYADLLEAIERKYVEEHRLL